MKSQTVLALGLACAACCAPLLLPLLSGAGAASALAWLRPDLVLCALPVAAIAAYLLLRRRAKHACNCASECGPACKPEGR